MKTVCARSVTPEIRGILCQHAPCAAPPDCDLWQAVLSLTADLKRFYECDLAP
jgi:hypothetical protein